MKIKSVDFERFTRLYASIASCMGKHPRPVQNASYRGRNRRYPTDFDTFLGRLPLTVFMVIVEIAGKYLRMAANFDVPVFLIFQSLAVSGVGQEQAHFLTLPANRRVMGKNIKDKILLLPVWLILFVIGLAVKMTVQTYAVVRGILGFIFTLLIIATAYCYHDWVQVAFLFSLSVILYLILFAGVFVDTVLDMTRERIIDFIIS